jgi:hypothetical protein
MSPSVKLFITASFNFILFYLLEWITYLGSLPALVPICIVLVLTAISILSILTKNTPFPFVVSGLGFWAILSIWILSFQLGVIVYGGSNWFGDWREHYERALFFLEQKPLATRFLLDLWSLPARGPLFNSSVAAFMSLFGKEFWTYQIIATVFNSFAVLPFALLIQSIVKIKQAAAHWVSIFIFALAPFAFQMELYTNTIFFTLAFFLGAIYLYRRGIRTNRPNWTVGGFLLFSAGFLADYLVLPFALFFAAHFFFVVSKRKWGMQPVIYSIFSCTLLVSTWFVFLFVSFGVDEIFKANSTTGSVYSKFYENVPGNPQSPNNTFVNNLLTIVVPYSFRKNWEGSDSVPTVVQKDSRFGKQFEPEASDSSFEWYCDLVNNQGSLLGNLGLAGLIGIYLATGCIVKNANIMKNQAKEATTLFGWKFWAVFFLVGIPLNIALSRTLLLQGSAHLNLHIYICLITIWIFKYSLKIPSYIKQTLAAIFIAESLLTLWAWMSLLSLPAPIIIDNAEKIFATGKLGLNSFYVNNFILKLKTGSVFLSEKMGTNGLQIGLSINFLLLITTSGIFYWTYKRAKLSVS